MRKVTHRPGQYILIEEIVYPLHFLISPVRNIDRQNANDELSIKYFKMSSWQGFLMVPRS